MSASRGCLEIMGCQGPWVRQGQRAPPVGGSKGRMDSKAPRELLDCPDQQDLLVLQELLGNLDLLDKEEFKDSLVSLAQLEHQVSLAFPAPRAHQGSEAPRALLAHRGPVGRLARQDKPANKVPLVRPDLLGQVDSLGSGVNPGRLDYPAQRGIRVRLDNRGRLVWLVQLGRQDLKVAWDQQGPQDHWECLVLQVELEELELRELLAPLAPQAPQVRQVTLGSRALQDHGEM